MTNREILTKLGACDGAVKWAAKYKTPLAAWRACGRGDWLLWMLGKTAGPPDSESRKTLVLVAAECAALALPRIQDEETRGICEATIQTCYAYAHGKATLEDIRDAAAAAYAAYAAYAAAYAAAAAYDAAADAAAYAAYAAAYAAAAAAAYAAAAYATAAARTKVLADCADIVRAYYPAPPRTGERE
jgi:hypothetical protein